MVESNPGIASAGYGGYGTGTGDGGGASTPPLDQIKQNAAQAFQQTKEKVGPAVSQVKDQAATQIQSTLSTQKDACANSLSGIAQAFRSTAENLRDNDQAPIGQYAETVAGWMDSATGYLNERDVNQVTRDVEDLARRQPAIFIGTTFAIGFLAARFLKSSASRAYDYRPSDSSYEGTIYAPGAYGSAIDVATPALPSSSSSASDNLATGTGTTGYGMDTGLGTGTGTGAIGTASGTPISGKSDLEIHTSPDYDDDFADDGIDRPETAGRL